MTMSQLHVMRTVCIQKVLYKGPIQFQKFEFGPLQRNKNADELMTYSIHTRIICTVEIFIH